MMASRTPMPASTHVMAVGNWIVMCGAAWAAISRSVIAGSLARQGGSRSSTPRSYGYHSNTLSA